MASASGWHPARKDIISNAATERGEFCEPPGAPRQTPSDRRVACRACAMIIMVITVNRELRAMITQTNAVTFRQNLGDMLNQVQYRHDSILINKDGKPVAALVDARLFERIRRMQGRFDALCQRIEVGFGVIAEENGLAEIEAAVADERRKAREALQGRE